jgi:hypothetical protein
MNKKVKPQTITEPDLFQLKLLQGVQLSPDGSMVVYAVSHIETDEAKAQMKQRAPSRPGRKNMSPCGCCRWRPARPANSRPAWPAMPIRSGRRMVAKSLSYPPAGKSRRSISSRWMAGKRRR